MKIFGINFTTKRELRATIKELKTELDDMCEAFPFDLGQTVYDVAFKDANGRYTKKNPSLEHSTITAVVVTKRNYFGLVERFGRNDVFTSQEDAKAFLEYFCEQC